MTLKSYTHDELIALVQERPSWLIEDFWAYEPTLLWGKSEQGKSFLAIAMLKALLCSDPDFLEKKVTPGDWRAVVLLTDPGDDRQYAKRVDAVFPTNPDDRMRLRYVVGRSLDHADWRTLEEDVRTGYNLVVIDNVNGAVNGNLNEPPVAREFFDRVGDLYDAGANGVLIVHHESQKWAPERTATPSGSSQFVSTSRWRIRVRKTNPNTRKLTLEGNIGPERELTVYTPGDRAVFSLTGSRDAAELEAARVAKTHDRRQARIDEGRELARYVLSHEEARTCPDAMSLGRWLFANPPPSMKRKPTPNAWRVQINRKLLGEAGLLTLDEYGFQAGARLNP